MNPLQNSEVCDPLAEAQTSEPFTEEELQLILAKPLTKKQERAVYGSRQAPKFDAASTARLYRRLEEERRWSDFLSSNGCSGSIDRRFMPAGF